MMSSAVVSTGLREQIGAAIGRLWSLPVSLISAARKARMFHPRGVLFTAEVLPDLASPYPGLSRRLEGPALVRCSGALFKEEVRRFEVLGIALRFSDSPTPGATPSPGDQDLLFATIVSPFTLAFSPFTTHSQDFLDNKYWAVSPFEVEGAGRLKFRITPAVKPEKKSGRRDLKLLEAVSEGRGDLWLEARETLSTGWQRIAIVRMLAPSDIDQEALRFDPFRSGRGIVPAGVVHSIRRDVYSASQRARPAHET